MKKNIRCLSFFAAIMFSLSAFQITAQTRGGDLELIDAGGEVVGRFLESHALVIGESEYTNGWRKLPGVKEDAAAVIKLFQEQGFNVETLLDANSRDLRNGIMSFFDKYGYNPDARLVLYFAGHGETRDLGGRRMGYIVPVDSPDPQRDERGFLQTAIPMTQFETWAKQYISRHILFIFDSCFSGSVFRSLGTTPPAINRLMNQPVRQFITSGDANEEVPDESIFRRELEYALRNGAADLNNDGYVSGTELGLYLYDRVSNYMNGKQNPRTGKLNDTNLDKGDFVFPVGNKQPVPVTTPSRPVTITTQSAPPQDAAQPVRIEREQGKPEWIYLPLNARPKFEQGGSGISNWYYDVGISNKTATEQLARTRARQDVQRVIAENIASDMRARIDITSVSTFMLSDIEETENRIETALTNSIRTRIPSYEPLEWYIEEGNTDGRGWFMAYVLVRFVRQDIIAVVERLDPAQMADAVIRALGVPVLDASANGREELILQIESARKFTVEMIRNGSGGR